MAKPVSPPLAPDREVDLHVWCTRETENMRALYTISCGQRAITAKLPKELALDYLSEYLDELNEED